MKKITERVHCYGSILRYCEALRVLMQDVSAFYTYQNVLSNSIM